MLGIDLNLISILHETLRTAPAAAAGAVQNFGPAGSGIYCLAVLIPQNHTAIPAKALSTKSSWPAPQKGQPGLGGSRLT